ncbi:response regulator [Cerasicoccus arenae]|uniref:DNA-binding response regulator n=1 Tax=Cerasicoccus arenae TaxID=424488 RepID=A0A8J3GD90_9BACT|nr:response regulator transcription factor [Cerasicoccus arenae]MBK1856932.1 response regulator transcription factor [Cerasicoccus arenae]GHB89908.1 DNA-binding response regulator [Cerasicoccus arenae]
MTTSTRLLIIEETELTRIGMRSLINQYPEFSIVGEAVDKKSAFDLYDKLQPDLVLMDMMHPDCSGLDICRHIRKSDKPAKLFLISSCCDHDSMIEAFSLGVEGYLLKDTCCSDLIQAMRDVVEGKTVMAPAVAEQVVEHMRSGSPQQQTHLIDSLSTQERRVLELVAKGLSNRQVAEELGLSEKTIKNYFSSVLGKLSANRRTEAAAMYWEYQKETATH